MQYHRWHAAAQYYGESVFWRWRSASMSGAGTSANSSGACEAVILALLIILAIFGADAAIDGVLGLMLVLVSGVFALLEPSE